MSKTWPSIVLAVLCALAVFAGYRIIAHTVADFALKDDPGRALRSMPDHPDALLALAQQQLAAGDYQTAAATARHLLSAAPLEGGGWRVLAQIEDAAGNTPQASALFETAVARGPRDVASRTWLATHYLRQGDYPAALDQIDGIIRFAPQRTGVLQPIIATLAQDPAFVDALVPVLATGPRWRGAFLREIQNGQHPRAAERVLAGLRNAGGLSDQEHQRWIADLMRQGRWGDAYVQWVATLPENARLTPVFNGGFDLVPGNRGFDWHTRRVPGVTLAFEADPSGAGHLAHVTFRRRRVETAGLEQPLLLAAGQRYQFSARMRARDLRSELGLEWIVQCGAGSSRIAGRSEAIDGSFDWRTVTFDVDIPADCHGQWLRLRNAAPRGAAQYLSGELWLDDVSITPQSV